MGNFDFIKNYTIFSELIAPCVDAEKSLAVSNTAAALQCRRALELAVKWLYKRESKLTVPYQDNLSSLTHDQKFKALVDPRLLDGIQFVITLGNKAAHQNRPMRRDQTVQALKFLFHFIRWLVYSYARHNHNVAYDESLIPDSEALERKNKEIQQQMEQQLKVFDAERKRLEDELLAVKEREKFTAIREQQPVEEKFTSGDISEYKTRKLYIDLALEMAGWEIGKDCLIEVPLKGMPNSSGDGYADYVLYSNNGKPLAVIEAKRTSKDPKIGKNQAKLYADCLAQAHGVRPLIYFTNGFELWFWDDNSYPERRVSGFFSRAELDWYNYRKEHIRPLDSVECNTAIAGRPYQLKAIQAVCENYQSKQRKALLVMATGSGKTRTAIALVDVLQRYGWVKNVLFLADRRELVKQAKRNFNRHLPNLSLCNLLDNKDDINSRMVFSTYPTMMNAIDNQRRADGSRLFTPGYFDLIIIDESHRSIYKKYQDIFSYFDGLLLGLTATPKSDIDKNTYSVFDIENGVPTFAYELSEAIHDKYLVPYKTMITSTKFMEQGIHYDELPDDEKEQWEDTFDDGVTDIDSDALNKFLFNDDTIDKVLHNLMENGIKVKGGDLIGKTIVFAKSTRHAEFILERFNKRYPHCAGKLASTIYNGVKYVDSVIEDFSEKDKYPQIAISVDMLDTGIDIPEILNLIFFKKVRSKSKFWQMIGRGTRLCENLFGPGHDKECFLIFDYCGNFEFFKTNPNGVEAKAVKSLNECLFAIKAKIARELQHSDYQDEKHCSHRGTLVDSLNGAVKGIDPELFSSRMRIEYIHKYEKPEIWQNISDSMLKELEDHIAGLIVPPEEDELSRRFDYLMFSLELAALQGLPIEKPKVKVMSTAARLSEKGNLPQVKAQAKLIKQVQTEEFWVEADIIAHEEVRLALRGLLQLLDSENTTIYFTSFTDELQPGDILPGEFGGNEFENYRNKVNAYLKGHKDDLVVYKLRHNRPLYEGDIRHLENILWHELGSVEDYHHAFGDEPLWGLAAKMVGLDITAANELFAEFLKDQSLNSNQMEFVNLIVNHIVENGHIDKEILNQHPFNKHGSIIKLFNDKVDIAKEIIRKIDDLNNRVVQGC